MTLAERIHAAGSKKILALDGGGIRGMMAIEVLAEIENLLRQQLNKRPEFRLAQFFDFVAGTSTGAIIAACISSGMAVSEIRDFYQSSGQEMFDKAFLLIGDVLRAQGDGPGALTAYRKGLAIGEALAKRDRSNIQWQIDVAVSCAKLGTHSGIAAKQRHTYLQRGLQIQQELKAGGRLPSNQDWFGWYTERLKEIK